MKTLEFIETLTIGEFKEVLGINGTDRKLEIKQNPKTGLLFATMTGRSGSVAAVSSKLTPETLDQLTKPMVSKVKGDPSELNPDGIFYLIHQLGEGAPTLMEL